MTESKGFFLTKNQDWMLKGFLLQMFFPQFPPAYAVPKHAKGPEQKLRPFGCKISIPLWLIVSFRLLNIKTSADDKLSKKIISFYRHFGRDKSLSFQ